VSARPTAKDLEGIWRLASSRAWDSQGAELQDPYGSAPMGQITFANGRMLAALCRGDADLGPTGNRPYSSYGGTYAIVDGRLEVDVDIALDPSRIGGKQVRDITFDGNRLVLRPPVRAYGESREQRELAWVRVWRPDFS
jgi:hypothetical protein